MSNKIGIFFSSHNNYSLFENECLKRIDFESYPVVNIDDHSSTEEQEYGRKICRDNNIPFLLNEGVGVQFATNTAMKYLQKNYDCKWVFCFQHDVWPLTKNFFTKFDNYIKTKVVDEIGAIGFNVLDRYNEYSGDGYNKFQKGETPKGWIGITVLSDNRSVRQKLPNNELIKRYLKIMLGRKVQSNSEITRRFFCHGVFKNYERISKKYNGLFSVEIPSWVCVAINVEKWFRYIKPTDKLRFHLWFNDVAYQFMENNIYIASTSDLYIENDQRIKIKYGMLKSSAHEVKKKDSKFMPEDGNHLEVFKQRWGWDYENAKDTYPKVKERFNNTLIDKFNNHDCNKGPYKSFN